MAYVKWVYHPLRRYLQSRAHNITLNSKEHNYTKFIGIGLQMMVIIAGFAFLGHYLDQKWAFKSPWMTIVCSLIGIGISMYQIIKSLK